MGNSYLELINDASEAIINSFVLINFSEIIYTLFFI